MRPHTGNWVEGRIADGHEKKTAISYTPHEIHFQTSARVDFAAPAPRREALPPRLVSKYNLAELTSNRPHSEGVIPVPVPGAYAKVLNTSAHSAFGGPFAKDEARRAVPRLDLRYGCAQDARSQSYPTRSKIVSCIGNSLARVAARMLELVSLNPLFRSSENSRTTPWL